MPVLISVALLIASASPQAAIEDPCGISGSTALLALDVYNDHSTHILAVDDAVRIDVRREKHGPLILRRAPEGDVLYTMPERDFDPTLRAAGEPPDPSQEEPIRVDIGEGQLYIDRSSVLAGQGAWVFVCWKEKTTATAPLETHREVYAGIETDPESGQPFIRRTDGSDVPLPTLRNQVDIDAIRLSSDHRRVGWLVEVPNCCTSYPVPRHLVIFKAGKIERVLDDDLCIFDWTFTKAGNVVAYRKGVLHGTDSETFVLRSVETGRKLSEYIYPDSFRYGEEQRAAAEAAAPRWVRDVPQS